MADVAAQREARRRKITQNSEARMNKLLGLTKKQNNESTSQSELGESPSSSPNSLSHSDQNEEQPTSLHLHSPNSTASTSLTSRNISSLTSPPSTDRSSNRPDYLISGRDSAANSISGDIGNIDTALQTPFRKSEPEARKTDTLLKEAQGFNAQTFEIVKIFAFIITAFLQRCVLKFGLGLFVVPSIFVPFVVLEITFEYVVYNFLQHIVRFQSKGNLMSAALMLCGMKQELTETYNNIMAHITVWLSDFCLYIFAFIFWNLLIA